MIEEALSSVLGLTHFVMPLAYYAYLKRVVRNPWDLRIDENYRPMVGLVVPTYMEARTISRKLDDIFAQDYPKEAFEVMVIDSASSDGTADLVKKWIENHLHTNVVLMTEEERRGKVFSLNRGLREFSPNVDIFIVTDADCVWRKDAVRQAVKYMADPIVGAVTCTISPLQIGHGQGISFDKGYRDINNVVRIAESKIWSTPIAHGPFVAYRRRYLEESGGIPMSGVDDSTPFSLISMNGYRCIQASDVVVYEYVPSELSIGLARRLRRAHGLVSHFIKMAKVMRGISGPFKRIMGLEIYLHIVNPWLLAAAICLSVMGVMVRTGTLVLSISFWSLIFGASSLGLYVPFRTWVLTQFLMMAGAISYMFKGELIMWQPISRRGWGLDTCASESDYDGTPIADDAHQQNAAMYEAKCE